MISTQRKALTTKHSIFTSRHDSRLSQGSKMSMGYKQEKMENRELENSVDDINITSEEEDDKQSEPKEEDSEA